MTALSPRELQVLTGIRRGLSTRAIAAELGMGVRTVETHVERALKKLGVKGRREYLAREYVQLLERAASAYRDGGDAGLVEWLRGELDAGVPW